MIIDESMALSELANAIIFRAVEDWRLAQTSDIVDGVRSDKVVEDVESFIKSDWFTHLTNLDGEYLLERLKTNDRQGKKHYTKPGR